MKSDVARVEERQFITKEFADTLAGKTPAPYLRVHDPAQQGRETRADLELTAMVSPFVGRIQIPLAQPLEDASFLLLQHLRQESTDLIDPEAFGQRHADAPEH